MRMHNPPHPGLLIRDDILPELGLTVTEAAKQLGVSRLINGKTGITADMALRLQLWLGEDSPSAGSWLRHQATYDLWQAEQKALPAVIPARLVAVHD